MATKTEVIYECDLQKPKCTGTENNTTHVVTIDGTTIELEACSNCWERTGIAAIVEAGRLVRGTKKRALRSTSSSSNGSNNNEIRAWARENGWPDLGERGRIPEEIQLAFAARVA